MGLAEYDGNRFAAPEEIINKAKLQEFKEKFSDAKKLHFGELGELERFKANMEAHQKTHEQLTAISVQLALIIKHFKIYPIFGLQNQKLDDFGETG